MTDEPLVVLGAGEHARVVIDAARSGGRWRPIGVVGSAAAAGRPVGAARSGGATPAEQAVLGGIPDLGDDDAYLELLAGTAPQRRPALIVGVGAIVDRRRRRAIVDRYGPDARWATVVHERAIVARSAGLEPGCVVLAGAIVGPNASIGAHAIVNSGAIVEHDVTIGAFAQVGPGVAVGGATIIGDDAFIGLGARVRDHVIVGPGATVGMGAVVVSDVAAGTTVVGLPARMREGSTRSE